MNAPKSRIDWAAVRGTAQLTAEEMQIVTMLAEGKTLPDIGRELGQHRSRIWRKVEKIKGRMASGSA